MNFTTTGRRTDGVSAAENRNLKCASGGQKAVIVVIRAIESLPSSRAEFSTAKSSVAGSASVAASRFSPVVTTASPNSVISAISKCRQRGTAVIDAHDCAM